MARIIIGSYVVRFPLGGYMSWMLQWLVGLQRLGHDVYFVEKSGWDNSCYDPSKDIMSNDCTYGITLLKSLLTQFGLNDRWCFVDVHGEYYGLSRERVEALFKSADVFVDMGMYDWMSEAEHSGLRVLVDGEPGYTQMKMVQERDDGEPMVNYYDFYYTVGLNIGTDKSTAPTAGYNWHTVLDPVVVDLFPYKDISMNAPFTTLMSWRAHKELTFNNKTYGQKDVEFEKFIHLPNLTTTRLELAVAGAAAGEDIPFARLISYGWQLRDPLNATTSFDSFRRYIAQSKGEFSVCKNVFVATQCGCFSERSAAYLASGRPVIMQDTGFSAHIPCGRGLFAIRTVEEAVAAIEEINRQYDQHSLWAHDIANEYLDASKVLGKFLIELGL